MEDRAEGRVRDKFFVFLRDRGLLVGAQGRESSDKSESSEERVEAGAELSLTVRAISGFCAGVSMRSGAGGPLLRCNILRERQAKPARVGYVTNGRETRAA